MERRSWSWRRRGAGRRNWCRHRTMMSGQARTHSHRKAPRGEGERDTRADRETGGICVDGVGDIAKKS